MVPLTQLWLPIVASAVLVFVVSSLIHMFLGYHANDFRALPDEERVRSALGPLAIPPGDYAIPHSSGLAELGSPEFREKMETGPVALLTVLPSGNPGMGRSLAFWFLYALVVSIFAGYIAGRALGPGADYLEVFRFAGAAAFSGYVIALWQNVIWYGRGIGSTAKASLDGLIYALGTAGVFGWLWPS